MAKPKDTPEVEIVILSVRNKRKSINIKWREGADTVDRDFHDNPLPSFLKSLDALVPHVISLCELSAKDEAKLTATGITVREDGDNTLGLIVARKKIKKGSRIMNISSPLLPMYEDEENKGADHMTADEARAIDKVVKETLKYLSGERAQGLIAFEDEKKKEEGDPNQTELPTGDGDTDPNPN